LNCQFCGTTLPDGALFCGECGRAVNADAPTQSIPIKPIELRSEAEAVAGAPPGRAVVVENIFRCPQCGEPISDADVFCGECGFVLKLTPPPTASLDAAAGDTATGDIATGDTATGDTAAGDTADVDTPADDVDELVEPAAAVPSAAAQVVEPLIAEPVIDEADIESEPEPDDGGSRRPVPPVAPSKKSLRKVPDPFPWGGGTREGRTDLEATRVTASRAVEERFVLQFSTGESITVSGAGLVGRNPSSQPGEFVDQLVTIFDAGKSVSKTHLEYGQDGGRFWVSDRYSTNGSTVRQPDADPRRCEPGRRYFVARGTRVDIGDQFFVVS
jgi:predicted nucleic acid-binding Zn ribbon protein